MLVNGIMRNFYFSMCVLLALFACRQGGRLFTSRNLNLPKIEEELDYVAFYFYEIR